MIEDNFGRRFFSIYDPDSKTRGVQEIINAEDLLKLNEEKFGIFWTVNEIEQGRPRKKEFIKKINALAFEVDQGTKEDQRKKIKENITPSLIIETKRGYHCYFFVKDFEPDADAYRNFLMDHIVDFYGADKNATDATRILRVPTFYHWKDVNDPFLVRTEFLNETKFYTKKQLEKFFPVKNKKEIEYRKDFEAELKFQKDSDLFARIDSLDQMEYLQRLSGTEAVGMEKITFRRQSNGNYAILVDNKLTSCWIDSKRRIGSSDKGGPTIWQWVNWYHKDPKKTFSLLKKILPEVMVNE